MAISRSSDTPSLAGTDDRLEPEDAGSSSAARESSETDALVTEALDSMMNPSGEKAEEAYQAHLNQLRERSDEIIAAVRDRYQTLDEQQYLERWGLIQLLTDFRLANSVSTLAEVLRQPIPPERSPDPAHGVSTVGEEVIIRTTAIEALARLAAEGLTSAKEQLLDQVEHDNFSVRRAAVQAIMESGDDELIQRVRRSLKGTDNERLLEFRRPDVRSVPQAEGGRFLKPDFAPAPPDPLNG